MAGLGRWAGRILAFGIPAAFGTAAFVYAETLKQPPAESEIKRPATPVRVLTMAPMPVVPRISGYGTVAPVREWRAVARIAGDISARADDLAPGALVPADTPLFRIDDADLRLSLAQMDAQLAAADVKDQTLAASLEIGKADLALAQAELNRQEQLTAQGVATRAGLDTARRQELSARAQVTSIENERRLAKAERDVVLSQKASVSRSLEFTEIRAPYDLRITEVSAAEGQYVSSGQTLLSGEGVEAAEIAAKFPMGHVGPLLRLAGPGAAVTDLKARVRLTAPGHDVTWKAQVVRVGDAIESDTQSATVVVRVEDPLGQAAAGERPPLRRNMFVEVLLMVPETELLTAPAEAVWDGNALVVTGDNVLEKRKVSIAFTMGDLAVIGGGLEAGDQLVITSPTIAVPGMQVKPVEDSARLAALKAEATGQAAPAGSGQGQGKGKSQEGEK
ncbi:efflux RND transporter periplasmic adaptor subunit [Salipiger sp. P9]|uniref:efflux RND transporter periplasmic adaptor subunit n=1 Tax=Salipiger pentaromativorans TaxID=2943193 RepID=UPI00215842A9|nr:efflux RND transporter periplasmic adaptor subunit [Salipiger pentaromativorans]MCR8549420.1 efflux RND transporter periplasmic adaptor subunit [Salipiger pentaromativorans]